MNKEEIKEEIQKKSKCSTYVFYALQTINMLSMFANAINISQNAPWLNMFGAGLASTLVFLTQIQKAKQKQLELLVKALKAKT